MRNYRSFSKQFARFPIVPMRELPILGSVGNRVCVGSITQREFIQLEDYPHVCLYCRFT